MSFIKFTKNGREYIDKLEGENATDFFNQDLANIYLSKYEEEINTPVNYNDLTEIILYKNYNTNVVLPNSLKKAHIQSAILNRLIINDTTAANIESIVLDFTNLSQFPDISKCINLKELTINHSNLTSLKLNYPLPPKLQTLNLRFNHISKVDFLLFKTHPKLKLNLSCNNLTEDTMDSIRLVLPYADLKLQGKYQFKEITMANLNVIDIRILMANMRQEEREQEQQRRQQIADRLRREEEERNRPQPNQAAKPSNNVLQGNSQTVHLTSINKSIVKSYKAIKDYLTTHRINNYQTLFNEKQLVKEMIEHFKRLKLTSRLDNISEFIEQRVFTDFAEKHSVLAVTYKQLFFEVWLVILNHKDSDNLMERFYTEIKDSIGMCFTGRMNRLVNVLVGWVDGVVVNISLKEEIQMSIQRIIKKLTDNKINFGEARKEIKEILYYNYDNVDPNDVNNFISDEYRKTWLEALNDYRPDPIIIKVNDYNCRTKTCKVQNPNNPNDPEDLIEQVFMYGQLTHYIAYNKLVYHDIYNHDNELNPIGILIDSEKQLIQIYNECLDKPLENGEKKIVNYTTTS